MSAPATILEHSQCSPSSARVFEFFDRESFEHRWFVAVEDVASVQLLSPTFLSEAGAEIFAACYSRHAEAFDWCLDGQLNLAHLIEHFISLERRYQRELDFNIVEEVCGKLASAVRNAAIRH